jgi:hypothetical protein
MQAVPGRYARGRRRDETPRIPWRAVTAPAPTPRTSPAPAPAPVAPRLLWPCPTADEHVLARRAPGRTRAGLRPHVHRVEPVPHGAPTRAVRGAVLRADDRGARLHRGAADAVLLRPVDHGGASEHCVVNRGAHPHRRDVANAVAPQRRGGFAEEAEEARSRNSYVDFGCSACEKKLLCGCRGEESFSQPAPSSSHTASAG